MEETENRWTDRMEERNIERKKICMMKERDIQKKDRDIGYR